MFKKLFQLFKELERPAPRPENISLLRDEAGISVEDAGLWFFSAGSPAISSVNGRHGGKLGRMEHVSRQDFKLLSIVCLGEYPLPKLLSTDKILCCSLNHPNLESN